MFIKSLRCTVCDEEYPRSHLPYKCDCGGGFEILYDYEKMKKLVSWKKLRSRPFNHWRYKEFYPTSKKIVTLNEGGTPLIRSAHHKKLWFKLESSNPTGSFKDRGSTVEISHALDFGHVDVVCASTGNMGASVSAYCSRADLDCEIILPGGAAGPKIEQIKSYGSEVTQIKKDYTAAANLAYQKFLKKGKFLVGDYAFRGEGEKSVGFEIVDEFLEEFKRLPDVILVPVGNGTLISGIWKGICEMKTIGLIKKTPMLIGVQAKGCNPIEKALIYGSKIVPQIPKTIAGAVACGDPLDGEAALDAIIESGGTMASFTDKEIIQARRELSELEGIDNEPAGVLGYAAWKKFQLENKYCVVVLCGHGLKDLVNK